MRKMTSRRIVLVAIMTALSIAGRFIPMFKPVTAMTIITGAYLGGGSGFLVGALSALLSNFYFGQGPWTPFQMMAWGSIGIVAGCLAKWLKGSRMFMLMFGLLSGIAYSLIMDIWTVLWYAKGFDWSLYMVALVTAIPHTVLYSISNLIFLFIMAKPFGVKLERIKIKYFYCAQGEFEQNRILIKS